MSANPVNVPMRFLAASANEKRMKKLLAALIVLAALGNLADTLFPAFANSKHPQRTPSVTRSAGHR